MERLTWLCCDCLLRQWVCECVFFFELMREQASHCSHCPSCKADEKDQPWAAICLSFSTRASSGPWSEGTNLYWMWSEVLKNGKLKIRLSSGISVLYLCSYQMLFLLEQHQINKGHCGGRLIGCSSCLFLLCQIFFEILAVSKIILRRNQSIYKDSKRTGLTAAWRTEEVFLPSKELKTASFWIICQCPHLIPIDSVWNRWVQPLKDSSCSAAAAAVRTKMMKMKSSL